MHREERGGWIVPEYIPFAPFEGCAGIAAYKEKVFDFRGTDLRLNEVRHGWVVSKYVPFVPHESKRKDDR